LPQKRIKEQNNENKQGGFALRVKIGEQEVEINGTYEEVTRILENLPNLITNVHKAFENAKPKTVATITVKTESPPKATIEATKQKYPKITSPSNCQEAVLRILETDWGKWRPRTMDELKEAMRANELKYPGRVLSETLNQLADKGLVRRWSTNTGFVYILAEEKSLPGGENQ
jgi:hypothetical protein